MANQHTYLLEPGLWTMEGIYRDREDSPHRQTGQILVVHAPGLWTIESQLSISGQDARDFETRYDVSPMPQGRSFTEWKSISNGPEPIFGLFVLVEDAIMMPWESESGIYWGQEVLSRVAPDEYRCRGFAFIKREKVSSWAVRMARADQGQAMGE
ncbi:MAG: hypothetical protein LBP92_06070 [Deltaproteobacteria bacterium]|nr:hypothetical protein [Deltaproteobacteria bacterium]